MVSKDRIESEEMTQDEVLDRMTAQPKESVEWVPVWGEHPEERPGENVRIEDETLFWERDGFEIALESYQTTHWKAVVSIPTYAGEVYPRAIDLKTGPTPESGFVDEVTTEDYEVAEAVLVISTNFQPVYEVNKWIDELIESAEESKEFMEDLSNKLSMAAENGD